MIQTGLGPVPDFVGILRRASVDEKTRALAARFFADMIAARNPLAADHGTHMLRPSNFGACALAFTAENLGLLDLDRADDNRVVMDTGTLLGAWFACLLKAGATKENTPWTVIPEFATSYRGVPGNADALIQWRPTPLPGPREIVEFKTTPSTGAIKSPDESKPYQCLQGGDYALDPSVNAERFTVITFGSQVGKSKDDIPHPKLVQHTFDTATWQPLVDAEIDRLATLLHATTAITEEPEALQQPGAFCYSCRYSACSENKNPSRFAL